MDTSGVQGYRPDVCPVCGAAFQCEVAAAEQCWCAALPAILPPEPGQSCLCPACLTARMERAAEKLNQ